MQSLMENDESESVTEEAPDGKAGIRVMHLLFGMDRVRELLAELQQYTSALETWRWTLGATLVLVVPLAVGYLQGQYPYFATLLFPALAVFGYALLMWMALLEKSDSVLQTLNNTLDVRAISPLCEALEWRDGSVRRVAQNTLPALLKQLRASDSLLLTRMARASLYQQLKLSRADWDEPLLTAILQSLEQVGDAQAVPPVERLVAETPQTASQERVHLAAQACLPYLHARFGHYTGRDSLLRATDQEEPTPHMLLRSSEGPAEDMETLLRYIKEAGDPLPEQLLRPGQ